jgi:hypothetical protein
MFVALQPSVTYFTPDPGMRLTSPQQVPCIFRLLSFEGNLDKLLSTLAIQFSPFPSRAVQKDQNQLFREIGIK